MSYRGTLHLGLHVDPAAVDDPAQLRGDIQAAFDELLTAASDASNAPGDA